MNSLCYRVYNRFCVEECLDHEGAKRLCVRHSDISSLRLLVLKRCHSLSEYERNFLSGLSNNQFNDAIRQESRKQESSGHPSNKRYRETVDSSGDDDLLRESNHGCRKKSRSMAESCDDRELANKIATPLKMTTPDDGSNSVIHFNTPMGGAFHPGVDERGRNNFRKRNAGYEMSSKQFVFKPNETVNVDFSSFSSENGPYLFGSTKECTDEDARRKAGEALSEIEIAKTDNKQISSHTINNWSISLSHESVDLNELAPNTELFEKGTSRAFKHMFDGISQKKMDEQAHTVINYYHAKNNGYRTRSLTKDDVEDACQYADGFNTSVSAGAARINALQISALVTKSVATHRRESLLVKTRLLETELAKLKREEDSVLAVITNCNKVSDLIPELHKMKESVTQTANFINDFNKKMVEDVELSNPSAWAPLQFTACEVLDRCVEVDPEVRDFVHSLGRESRRDDENSTTNLSSIMEKMHIVQAAQCREEIASSDSVSGSFSILTDSTESVRSTNRDSQQPPVKSLSFLKTPMPSISESHPDVVQEITPGNRICLNGFEVTTRFATNFLFDDPAFMKEFQAFIDEKPLQDTSFSGLLLNEENANKLLNTNWFKQAFMKKKIL